MSSLPPLSPVTKGVERHPERTERRPRPEALAHSERCTTLLKGVARHASRLARLDTMAALRWGRMEPGGVCRGGLRHWGGQREYDQECRTPTPKVPSKRDHWSVKLWPARILCAGPVQATKC